MFYVVETKYVGPNKHQERYVDVDVIEIRSSPAIFNSSKDECIEGWCGTTNEFAVYAHSAYKTIQEAEGAIKEQFGSVRDADFEGRTFESDDSDVVKVYKVGKYFPISSDATECWIEGGLDKIEHDSSDKYIYELMRDFESEANKNGLTLSDDLEDIMMRYRNFLREKFNDYN